MDYRTDAGMGGDGQRTRQPNERAIPPWQGHHLYAPAATTEWDSDYHMSCLRGWQPNMTVS